MAPPKKKSLNLLRQFVVLVFHPITVVQRGDKYVLLSGNHRLECFKHLGRDTIPALIKDEGDELIEQLVECQENLVRADPQCYPNSRTYRQAGRVAVCFRSTKASRGDNRWKRSGVRTEDLARSMGVTKRAYQYKKSVSNLHPEVKDILGETIFSHNLMDMVVLAKESDEIQLEVANLLATGKSNTFKRAMQLARCSTWVQLGR